MADFEDGDLMDIGFPEMSPEEQRKQRKLFEQENAWHTAVRSRDEYRRELLDVATRIFPSMKIPVDRFEQIDSAIDFAEYLMKRARERSEAAVAIPQRPEPPEDSPFGSGRIPHVATRLRPVR